MPVYAFFTTVWHKLFGWRCPECQGSGYGNYFNGDVSGCVRCEATGRVRSL